MSKLLLRIMVLFCASSALANEPNSVHEAEHEFSGLIDLRYTMTDSLDSYLEGGYGKFRYSDGSRASLNQLGIKYQVNWSNWQTRIVGNVYTDSDDKKIGITEAFVAYKGVPSARGVRFNFRAGLMYPIISLENTALAWNSPYTLSWSMQNTWLAQEVRHIGLEARIDLLGKARGADSDLSLLASLFQYNDPTGALLAWQGWTMSSRQALFSEQMPFPTLPAQAQGMPLASQDSDSSPFEELDDRWGAHVALRWQWRRNLDVLFGYYDNHTEANLLEDGDYAWQTHFRHLGLDWRIGNGWRLLVQHMSGDTRMRVAGDVDLVSVNFRSSFARFSYQRDRHRLAFRVEDFWNRDFDNLPGDRNNERGDAWTLAYQYRLTPKVYLGAEYNRIESRRAQRGGGRVKEDQTQFALRYFF